MFFIELTHQHYYNCNKETKANKKNFSQKKCTLLRRKKKKEIIFVFFCRYTLAYKYFQREFILHLMKINIEIIAAVLLAERKYNLIKTIT